MSSFKAAILFAKELVVDMLSTGNNRTSIEVEKSIRHGSSFQVRENVFVKWYIDGKDYFYAVSEALLAAKEEIYIESWWLSPELNLRGYNENEEYRLDRILEKKAKDGVKIYVVLYNESLFLDLNSERSEEVLRRLHKNILVQRHPKEDFFYWAHHERTIIIDRHISFIGGLDLCFENYDTSAHQLSNLPDTPCHGTSICFIGGSSIDLSNNFIQKWNHIREKHAGNNSQYPELISDKNNHRHIHNYNSAEANIRAQSESSLCSVQILRSSSLWSHGIQESECSIQNAYIDAIENAKNFIYIENQFFTTATKETEDHVIKNLIGKAIVERIVRAYQNDERFRVIVCLQLIPAFSDKIDENTYEDMITCISMHYQYQSIIRGKHSIIEQVKEAGCNNSERYIGFYALRAYGQIDLVTPITKEILIQSKLLIADDRTVIIGSANLMDRSLNGDRDSEVAAIIKDKNYIKSKMNGMRWEAGQFSATLRRAIFKEHLGLKNDNPQKPSYADRVVEDPTSDKFYYDYWLRTANTNTSVFRNVFHCVPDDTVTNWDEYETFTSRQNLTDTKAEFSKIKGHLVMFPMEFMNGEDLMFKTSEKDIPIYCLI